MEKIIRIFLLPLGLLKKISDLAADGARDLHNSIRFRSAIIDRGCCIDRNSMIIGRSRILDNCFVLSSVVGRYTYIGKNSVLQNAKIGSFCSIASEVVIGMGSHPLDYVSTSPLFYRKRNTFRVKWIDTDADYQEYADVVVGNDVWIGTRALVMGGVKIGNGAVIAANSVVNKDVPPYAIVAGVPAKVIKFRFCTEDVEKLLKSNWWDMEVDRVKRMSMDVREL